jgi:hypothetical protein
MQTEYGVGEDHAEGAAVGLAKSRAPVDLNQAVWHVFAEASGVDLSQLERVAAVQDAARGARHDAKVHA